MRRIVCTLALFFWAVRSGPAAPSPDLWQSPAKGVAPSEREEGADVKTVTCDWASGHKVDPARLAEDNAVKLALYNAVVSGKGVVRALKTCSTIEGDPNPIHATAERGKIKVTHDHSQDRWLGFFKRLPKFFTAHSYTTRQVQIGYFDQGKFVPSGGGAPKDQRLFLKLRGEEYF